MDISIKTGKCRFGGIGDWPSYDEIIAVPQKDWRYEFLVALHELVEAQLCKASGVTAEAVDRFDAQFEKDRPYQDEPGDDPYSPYYSMHQTATVVERIVCQAFGLDWKDYLSITAGL